MEELHVTELRMDEGRLRLINTVEGKPVPEGIAAALGSSTLESAGSLRTPGSRRRNMF